MKTFLIVAFLVVFSVIVHGIYKKNKKKNDAKEKERNRLRLLDIAKNPQNYFVSEGGTKPDPEPELAQEESNQNS